MALIVLSIEISARDLFAKPLLYTHTHTHTHKHTSSTAQQSISNNRFHTAIADLSSEGARSHGTSSDARASEPSVSTAQPSRSAQHCSAGSQNSECACSALTSTAGAGRGRMLAESVASAHTGFAAAVPVLSLSLGLSGSVGAAAEDSRGIGGSAHELSGDPTARAEWGDMCGAEVLVTSPIGIGSFGSALRVHVRYM